MAEDGAEVPVGEPQEPGQPADEEALGQLLESVAQCTAVAMGQRKSEQPLKALRQMERAVKLCQGREHLHPAVAVEAARARLNLAGLLSSASRHLEAVDSIKEAQQCLASVLAWVADCEGGDAAVETIAAEARSLQCAAMLAEAIELEPFSATSPGQRKRRGMHEELYRRAQSVASGALPARHPVASLAARLSRECAVCAPELEAPEEASKALGSPSHHQSARAAPAAATRSASDGLQLPAVRQLGRQNSRASAGSSGAREPDEPSFGPEEECEEELGETMMPPKVGPERSVKRTRSSAAAAGRGRANSSGAQAKSERHDVFTDFLRGAELDQAVRLGPLHESMQDDVRKRLAQVHRTTRLQLELTNDVELKEKRYSKTGHRVFMRNLARDNGCRSDPNLMSEARKQGETPEIAQVKKLYRQLYVPPKTPQVEVKVAPKAPPPEVEFLKETGSATFKRSLGFSKVPDVF